MNKRKKLLFLLLSSSYGGLEIHSVDFCKWMSERGWNINLLCATGSAVMSNAVEKKIKIYNIEKPKKYFDINKVRKALKLLETIKPDILFVSDNNDLNFAVLLKKFYNSGLKLVYILHMQIGVSKKDLYHRFIFRNIDKWVVPLQYLKLQTLQRTTIEEKKIEIIRHSSDVEKLLNTQVDKTEARKIFNLPYEGFVIGMNARIDRQKNQHIVIETLYKIISGSDKKIFFLMLGRPTMNEGKEYYDYIINFIREKKLDNYVVIKDYLEDISCFYKAIDALIVPTRTETYGQNTIEAVIYGVPVIGTDSGGTKEILQDVDSTLLYNPENKDDLSGKILLLQDKYDYYKEKFLKASKYFSDLYSKERECANYEELIEKL